MVVRDLIATRKQAMNAEFPEPTPIDIDHLTTFTDGDGQLERELFALYLSTAGVYLDRMRKASPADRAWSAAAHALKGASANLGAHNVAALAGKAEIAPLQSELLEVLDAAINDVRNFVERRARDAP